jgi:ATP-dependent Clp protease ATP-binding subunit ClpC
VSEGLDGFGPAARQAITAAEEVAAELGTSRVGTEHLLLGVLAVGSCAAAARLREAGAGRSAVLRKVGKTSMGSTADPASTPSRSPRAERALNRAHRFAHDRRSPEARSEHLLLGILDVEGTAGQVLRGLGVDVDALRSVLAETDLDSLDEVGASEPAPATMPATGSSAPRCPSCAGDLESSGLRSTTVTAGSGRATVLSCPACGTAIGAVPD